LLDYQRPLLDNGSVTTFPESLSGRQTGSRGSAYVEDPYHGNESLKSVVSAVTNTLAAVVLEYRKLEGSTKCSPLGWRKIVLRMCRHRFKQLRKTVKSAADADNNRVSKKEGMQTNMTQEDSLSKKRSDS
jgi:hypothetical protein